MGWHLICDEFDVILGIELQVKILKTKNNSDPIQLLERIQISKVSLKSRSIMLGLQIPRNGNLYVVKAVNSVFLNSVFRMTR